MFLEKLEHRNIQQLFYVEYTYKVNTNQTTNAIDDAGKAVFEKNRKAR